MWVFWQYQPVKSYQKEKEVIEKMGLADESFEKLSVNCRCGRHRVSAGY
jgi:hypothetical protein